MIDSPDLFEAVLRLREPMAPLPTNVSPSLQRLNDIEAVIFDIYGTLLISGTGDVGSAENSGEGGHIEAALRAVGWLPELGDMPTTGQLHHQIRSSNESRIGPDCPKPEVDILEIWRRTLRQAGLHSLADNPQSVARLSAEYEARSNRTWPMPGGGELLAELADRDMALGIVSNAQAFTLPLINDLVGGCHFGSGRFDANLCIYSFRFRQAKPGPRLFAALNRGLKGRGIPPERALYVGNDMLNDVWAAGEAGLRTAWFAGDERSCRPRSDVQRCRNCRPDLVLTELTQLYDCLPLNRG